MKTAVDTRRAQSPMRRRWGRFTASIWPSLTLALHDQKHRPAADPLAGSFTGDKIVARPVFPLRREILAEES